MEILLKLAVAPKEWGLALVFDLNVSKLKFYLLTSYQLIKSKHPQITWYFVFDSCVSELKQKLNKVFCPQTMKYL